MKYKVGQRGYCSIVDEMNPQYNMQRVLCEIHTLSSMSYSKFPYTVKLINYTDERIDVENVRIQEKEFKPKIINVSKFYKNNT